MKKLATLAISLVATATAWAQSTPVPVMHVNLKDGTTVDYTLSEIADLTFEEVTPAALPVAFAVPADFSSSYVQKVMADGKQVAEVDLEYVKGLGQVTVVYPCDANGKAILSKGITSKGATVAWGETAAAPTVGTEGDAIAKFYIVDGELLTTYDGETQEGTLRPDLLVDRRGTESQSYRLVKIGIQYWTADNIRATRFTDGTAITAIGESDTEAWSANTTGAYLTDSEADWVAVAGYLYNGYCAVSDKMTPEGWHIPTCADYGAIRTSVGARTAALYKDSLPGTWSEGMTGNNQTGFSVVATGYFSTATGLNAMFSDTYIWTSDSAYDALSKSNAIDFFRISGSANNATFPTKGLNPHTYNFGHCLRFVRN